VQVDKGVPIYISYLTARPDGEKLAFATDVYKLDSPVSTTKLVAAGSAPGAR
jgi:murein L,D-transpeptidase YcbB/YkuD